MRIVLIFFLCGLILLKFSSIFRLSEHTEEAIKIFLLNIMPLISMGIILYSPYTIEAFVEQNRGLVDSYWNNIQKYRQQQHPIAILVPRIVDGGRVKLLQFFKVFSKLAKKYLITLSSFYDLWCIFLNSLWIRNSLKKFLHF